MRPRTPTLNIGQAAGVNSPPQTPTTGSPTAHRKPAINLRPSPKARAGASRPRRSNIRPLGDGHSFSYTRGVRPEEISPRSSDSSDGDGEASEDSASPPQSPASDFPGMRGHTVTQVTSIRIVQEATFILEELSDDDPMDSDDDGVHLDVIRPSGFEYADSDRSRSRSRARMDLPAEFVKGFQDMTCFPDDSEDESDDFEKFKVLRRERNRIRRMTSGSMGKRTVSERGSDPDEQDLLPFYDKDEAGPTMRRTRRKTDRWSSQFLGVGGISEIIEELKEPDDEILIDEGEILARELPYYKYMEVDDSE